MMISIYNHNFCFEKGTLYTLTELLTWTKQTSKGAKSGFWVVKLEEQGGIIWFSFPSIPVGTGSKLDFEEEQALSSVYWVHWMAERSRKSASNPQFTWNWRRSLFEENCLLVFVRRCIVERIGVTDKVPHPLAEGLPVGLAKVLQVGRKAGSWGKVSTSGGLL